MSGRKYVPSFLKNQTATPNAGAGSSTNQFAAFDDDFVAPKAATATPTMTAPTTLASTTSTKSNPYKGGTYAQRFSNEKALAGSGRASSTLASTTIKVDTSSENQFPILGGAVKKQAGAWGKKSEEDESKTKFASLAKGWAKQTEDEEVAAELKRREEEKKRQEEEMLAALLKSSSKRIKTDGLENPDILEDDYFSNPYTSHDQLNDEDSVEMPSEEESTEDDEDEDYIDENGEYNINIVYDGRRKDDLY
jgi:hypothetical protein